MGNKKSLSSDPRDIYADPRAVLVRALRFFDEDDAALAVVNARSRLGTYSDGRPSDHPKVKRAQAVLDEALDRLKQTRERIAAIESDPDWSPGEITVGEWIAAMQLARAHWREWPARFSEHPYYCYTVPIPDSWKSASDFYEKEFARLPIDAPGAGWPSPVDTTADPFDATSVVTRWAVDADASTIEVCQYDDIILSATVSHWDTRLRFATDSYRTAGRGTVTVHKRDSLFERHIVALERAYTALDPDHWSEHRAWLDGLPRCSEPEYRVDAALDAFWSRWGAIEPGVVDSTGCRMTLEVLTHYVDGQPYVVFDTLRVDARHKLFAILQTDLAPSAPHGYYVQGDLIVFPIAMLDRPRIDLEPLPNVAEAVEFRRGRGRRRARPPADAE